MLFSVYLRRLNTCKHLLILKQYSPTIKAKRHSSGMFRNAKQATAQLEIHRCQAAGPDADSRRFLHTSRQHLYPSCKLPMLFEMLGLCWYQKRENGFLTKNYILTAKSNTDQFS